MANLARPRIREQRERRYDLPLPLNQWDDRNRYQQYFIIPDRKAIVRGGSGSSHQREIKSKYGYAFAMVNKEDNLMSYLFVYTSHNRLKYVDTVYEFCLVNRDMGSNYYLPSKEADAILQDTVKVECKESLSRIREIVLFK
jgi:hypothetical protein